jgi:hypothetical protein
MRFPYLVWLRKWRRGAVDDEVTFGRLLRGAAWGGGDSGEGVQGVGLDQVRGLGEEVEKQLAEGIWAGWRC